MSATEDTLSTIHSRLQELSMEATPEQLAYLAKAFEMVASNGKMIDIAHLSDQKLEELLAKMNEYIENLSTNTEIHIGELNDTKNAAVSEILSVTNQNTQLINSLADTRNAELTSVVADFEAVNDIPVGSSILSEIYKEGDKRKFLQTGALPFVYGILSRYNDYYGTGNFSTELGDWTSSTSSADHMLQLLAGCHTNTTQYAGFYKEPSLCFLQGQKGNFIQKEQYLKYASSSNMYTYPYAALGVFFVKNPTNQAITATINSGGSSYSEAAMFIGTPNSETETLTWTNVFSYTSSTYSFSKTSNFTVPPNSTAAILLYTSSYYITTANSYYAQFLQWYVHSFRSVTLVGGLEIDLEKTMKAWQSKGFSSTYDLWRQ
jgi:hypothetical protein